MAIDAQDMIANVSVKANIDPTAAETAVGTIFSIFQHEAPAAQVGQLFAAITGAADLAQRYDVTAAPAGGGGLFGALEGALGGMMGGKIVPLLHGIERLKASGLSVAQIEQAGMALIAEAKGAAGGDLVQKLVGAVPGLAGHIGA
jgi:hypothetical protein